MTIRLSHSAGDFIAGKDHYKVLEKIKSGGMGTVYKVEKVLTGNLFAVKECDLLDDPRKRQLSREEAVRIFVREGRLLETLKHPGIPAGFLLAENDVNLLLCLQCGNPVAANMATCGLCRHSPSSVYYRPQQVDTRYYLFMDFIEGVDAAEMKTKKPLSAADLRQLLAWTGQLASVLCFLHGRGLVHRDVKPENLRIGGKDKRLFLLDYGLLVEEEGGSGGPDAAGANTDNLGTAGYAPAEQARGRATSASDIHALAMSFLNLATGLDPANPLECRQLTATAPEALVPGLDPALASLLRDSLATEPQRRPSAEQWLAAVEAMATGTPVPRPGASSGSGPVPATRSRQPPTLDPAPPGTSRSAPARVGYLPRQQTAKRARVPVRWLLAALALALALGWFFNPGIGERHQVVGKPGAIIYTDPGQGSVLRTLAGGELLEVTEANRREAEGNWLRVLAVDDAALRGYVNRAQVRAK